MSVYFITAREVGKVKIGCAYDPAQRLERMQGGSPCKLVLEALLKGSYAEERQIHKLFADERLHGEWFVITEEIEKAIAANRVGRAPNKEEMARLMPAKPPREPHERSELRELKRRLKSGDIHFPFRSVPNDSSEMPA